MVMRESSNDNLTVFVSQLSYQQAANNSESVSAGRLAVLFLMDVVLKL